MNLLKGWIEADIGESLISIRGISFPKDAKHYQSRDGLIAYLRTANVQTEVDWNDLWFVDEKYLRRENQIIRKGDILISISNSLDLLGKVALVKDIPYKSTLGTFIASLRCPRVLNNKFIYYFLTSARFKEDVRTNASTTTNISNISVGKLQKLNIKLAPLPEQHRIVAKLEALFSDLDNAIESLKKAKEQLNTYRQAVLKWAFEGKLTEEWRKENKLEPAEKLLEKIKQERERLYQEQLENWKQEVKKWEEGGKKGKKPSKPKKPIELLSLSDDELSALPQLPSGYLYINLSYLGELARGKSKHRPRNDKKLFGGKYPFIQTGEVKANGVISTYNQTYNDYGLAQSKLWSNGTLCITIAANIAETAFLGIDACFPDSIVGFKEYEAITNTKFINYFIQSAKQKIQAFAPATAQKNINLKTLENLIIPYCSLEEQNIIVEETESRLSVCDNLESNLEETLDKVEALRQSILKKAFEGKLVLQDPNDEPAWELLERIKAEKSSTKTKGKESKNNQLGLKI